MIAAARKPVVPFEEAVALLKRTLTWLPANSAAESAVTGFLRAHDPAWADCYLTGRNHDEIEKLWDA